MLEANNCCVISSILFDTQRKLNTDTHLAHKLDLYIFSAFVLACQICEYSLKFLFINILHLHMLF